MLAWRKLVDAAVLKTEVLSGACRFESCRGHHRNQIGIPAMIRTGKKMKPLEEEIARIDAEIERLKVRRETIIWAKERLSGNIPLSDPPASAPRKRAANVKPLILDIMAAAAANGATSGEVDERVREKA